MMQGGTADELMAQEKTDSLVSKLHRILTPFVLRRTKLGVLPPDALPPKREVVVFCGMTQVSSSMSPYAYLPMLTHLVCLHTLTYQSSRRAQVRSFVSFVSVFVLLFCLLTFSFSSVGVHIHSVARDDRVRRHGDLRAASE